MRSSLQVCLITAGCIGLFFTIRSLPLEKCSFLHYGEFINEEGVIEGCGYEETDFFTMSELRYPVIAEVTPLGEADPGTELTCKLTLFTTTGNPIRWEDIAISHTERIHAMIVDSSLEDYQHIHPQPAGPPGHYLFNFTPEQSGEYRVYLDFISLTNSRRTLLESSLTIGQTDGPKPISKSQRSFSLSDLQFNFTPQQLDLIANSDLIFTLEVASSKGGPLTFSPVMDAFAHMVAFDENRTGFAHLHPLNPLIQDQDPQSPDLRFAIRFPEGGYYRIWAQMIINGSEVFVPFDLQIAPS